ncbi:MAG: hypothetical protein EAX89_11955 [Candidatus Lokiarchaeota archaeon]|nr:hypothetical protein [Candidatus Lokiarchaeota archaeon]
MISQVLIIAPGGILCYSKKFFNKFDQSEEIVSSLLAAISQFAKEIKAGEVQSLNFGNFKFIFDYEKEYDFIFVVIIDVNDFEEDTRSILQLIKDEFLRRYRPILKNWGGNRTIFENFTQFIEKNIFLPPKVILTGQAGVGKTTIFDLFPGEKILKIDDNFNEYFIKLIPLNLNEIKECIVREIDLNELVKHSRIYNELLRSAEIIFVVTNSAARNLGKTQELLSELIGKMYKADLYIIANFQDYKDIAFEPEKIGEFFNIKAFGFSAIEKDAQEKIFEFLIEVVKASILERDKIIRID